MTGLAVRKPASLKLLPKQQAKIPRLKPPRQRVIVVVVAAARVTVQMPSQKRPRLHGLAVVDRLASQWHRNLAVRTHWHVGAQVIVAPNVNAQVVPYADAVFIGKTRLQI